LFYRDGKCVIKYFMMLLLSAQSPLEAFDNWRRIQEHLQSSAAEKIPPDEIQFLFKVAETSLEKFQVDQQCLKCRGCRKQHPELKREYRKADDAKVEFIPVSSFSTADLRR